MLTRALLDVRSLLDQSFVFVRLSELLASRASRSDVTVTSDIAQTPEIRRRVSDHVTARSSAAVFIGLHNMTSSGCNNEANNDSYCIDCVRGGGNAIGHVRPPFVCFHSSF